MEIGVKTTIILRRQIILISDVTRRHLKLCISIINPKNLEAMNVLGKANLMRGINNLF